MRLCGNWSSVFRNDSCHHDLRVPRLLVSFEPWWSHDGYASALGFHGTLGRIRFFSSLQNVARNRVEENRSENRFHVPRDRLCRILRP
uniref:Uncharacterized protein n=1 Tax=Brassica oleracea TaxID=3712 RepID=A0A3P6GEJ9_BRAOL|nr:unnamed protein product [Brassica oleracea]